MAVSAGCASKLNERFTVNLAGSVIPTAQEFQGDSNSWSGRAGFVFKLGSIEKPTMISYEEKREIQKQNKLLENKIRGIVSQKEEVKNSNQELRKLIALQTKQINSQNERLQKLENIALAKYHQIDKKGSKNIKPENKEDKNIVISFLQRFQIFSNLSAYLK